MQIRGPAAEGGHCCRGGRSGAPRRNSSSNSNSHSNSNRSNNNEAIIVIRIKLTNNNRGSGAPRRSDRNIAICV